MTRSLTCLALALLLCGCPAPESGGASSGRKDALDLAKQRGKLIVAMDVPYDPFEVTGKDGEAEGFDVDLAAAVAKDMGVALEIKKVAWTGIIGELRTGKADVIFSGMSVTEERKEAVLFTLPYYAIGQVYIRRKGDDRFADYKALNDARFTIAVQQNTTGEQACNRLIPNAKLLRFDKIDQACVALAQKKADAVVFDHPFLIKYLALREKDDLEGNWAQFTSEDIAAACRKDSPKLIAAIEATFERLRKSGELHELVLRYFKSGKHDEDARAKEKAEAPTSPPGGG